eukprot:1404138-Amphidinium_carterae.1
MAKLPRNETQAVSASVSTKDSILSAPLVAYLPQICARSAIVTVGICWMQWGHAPSARPSKSIPAENCCSSD